jgi:RHS repeat-associated protein
VKADLLDIETHNSNWQKIDYRPFGEQSWTATEGVVRRGFGGDLFDIESGFIRMGPRLYEPETGRFTSVDPLFEAFKRWSPYTYSYNSPLTFRDPTGLAPEKEKYKDEIMQYAGPDIVALTYGFWVAVQESKAESALNFSADFRATSVAISDERWGNAIAGATTWPTSRDSKSGDAGSNDNGASEGSGNSTIVGRLFQKGLSAVKRWLGIMPPGIVEMTSYTWEHPTQTEIDEIAREDAIRENKAFFPNGEINPHFTGHGLESNDMDLLIFAGTIRLVGKGVVSVLSRKVAANISSSVYSYITPKIKNDITNRGWTTESIHNLVNHPYTTRNATNKATNNAATAYFNKDGTYVVRDNVTMTIIQISDRTRPWLPDATIINPYFPR